MIKKVDVICFESVVDQAVETGEVTTVTTPDETLPIEEVEATKPVAPIVPEGEEMEVGSETPETIMTDTRDELVSESVLTAGAIAEDGRININVVFENFVEGIENGSIEPIKEETVVTDASGEVSTVDSTPGAETATEEQPESGELNPTQQVGGEAGASTEDTQTTEEPATVPPEGSAMESAIFGHFNL